MKIFKNILKYLKILKNSLKYLSIVRYFPKTVSAGPIAATQRRSSKI